ncbi:MAG: hypothetical protein QM534_11945 [Sediminibacterium sp.]|nr:hypothetical protein [Sediminibacterium sp.]
MKTMTSNLLKFAAVASVLTVTFRLFLSIGIENRSNAIIMVSAIAYFIAMFLAGWIFGKKEWNHLPIHDVGFRFHLTTYLAYIILSELWFALNFHHKSETIITIHITAAIWGVFLLCHFIYYLYIRKNTINHLDKEELFD